MQCGVCSCIPEDNNERYYSVRRSNTGLDFDVGMIDEIYCEDCLTDHIALNGISDFVSIVRLQNPLSVGDK